MPLVSLHFRFVQRFHRPAREVFAWATDYQGDDLELMGLQGTRRVERLGPDTLVLTDSFASAGRRVTKKKLVRLFPERLAWTNTHLAGPNRHSQFLYELVPEGPRACHLVFTGNQVDYPAQAPTPEEARALAKRVRSENAATWKRLAAAFHQSR